MKEWDPPNRHGDTHKRNGPTYHFTNGGTEPREEVSSLSPDLLTAEAQCGCGGLVALTVVRKVTIEVRNGENEVAGCADLCWGPQRHLFR